MGLFSFGKKEEAKPSLNLKDIQSSVVGKNNPNQDGPIPSFPPERSSAPPMPKPPQPMAMDENDEEDKDLTLDLSTLPHNEAKRLMDKPAPKKDQDLFDLHDLDIELDKLSAPAPKASKEKVAMDEDDSDEEDNHEQYDFERDISSHASPNPEAPLFITTEQYKSMADLVEQVKERVKNSSDTYLKILDYKGEEEIELENLRKDFEFIEDKLYQLDSLLFDK